MEVSFADPSSSGPEPPLAPSVPDSVHAQIRRLYVYIVCGFICDFCFYSSSYLPGLVPRVRPSLSDADNRLASLLAFGLLPPLPFLCVCLNTLFRGISLLLLLFLSILPFFHVFALAIVFLGCAIGVTF